MKISGLEFSKAGDKYLGRSYQEMDCQAFVEKLWGTGKIWGEATAGIGSV